MTDWPADQLLQVGARTQRSRRQLSAGLYTSHLHGEPGGGIVRCHLARGHWRGSPCHRDRCRPRVGRREVSAVADGGVTVAGVFGEPPVILPADVLVPVAGARPVSDIYAALADAHHVWLPGVALRPRRVKDAAASANTIVEAIASTPLARAEEFAL